MTNQFESFVQSEEVAMLMREYGPSWREQIKRLADQNRVSISIARRAMIVKAVKCVDMLQPVGSQPDIDDVKASEKLE